MNKTEKRYSNYIYARRLYKLADLLRTAPKEGHFNMSDWLEYDNPGLRDKPITKANLNTCGTRACAMGWALTLPFAPKQTCGLPVTIGRTGHLWSMSREMFGTNDADFSYLFFFNGRGHVTAKEQAKYIEDFAVGRYGYKRLKDGTYSRVSKGDENYAIRDSG